MNTTPSTFKEMTYTAVGGTDRGASTGLSAVLLNRTGRYHRRTLFQELEKTGFDYIISMEGPHERYDVEELSGRFPQVRFILLKENMTYGEQINIAANELPSPLFFILWNDLRILHSGGASRIAERLLVGQDDLQKASMYKRLCTVPLVQNSRFETIPTLIAPALFRDSVKTLTFLPIAEGKPSLFPFDWVGVYDRERFIRLGGFDAAIKREYWQLMDFGFRAHLWGEEILSTHLIRVSYSGEIQVEDSTFDESYRRFFLKNIAPTFRGDSAYLPFRRFFSYCRYSKGNMWGLWKEFMRVRRWVRENSFRFRYDVRAITELWDDFSEDFIHEGGVEND
ncbi:MAG: hypothetical protein LBI40_01685 [Treponema sp.]|jgi:hypothetical protein|nr:hypothetical protein [Treponema sp.]